MTRTDAPRRAPLRVAVARHNAAGAAAVVRAAEAGVRVVLFPGLSLTGYGHGPELTLIREACRATGVTAVAGDGVIVAPDREPGAGSRALTVDGWRLALGISQDARSLGHARAAARSGADACLWGAFVYGPDGRILAEAGAGEAELVVAELQDAGPAGTRPAVSACVV